jgi:hypothetical protein
VDDDVVAQHDLLARLPGDDEHGGVSSLESAAGTVLSAASWQS